MEEEVDGGGGEKFTFLAALYHDVKSPASFSSASKLMTAARELGRTDISLKDIKDFLKTQISHSRHGCVPKTFRKRMVIVTRPGLLLSSDLADMTNIKQHNEGYCYLLFLIDCFSRKLHIVPLRDKKGATVAKALDEYLSNTSHSYVRYWVDRGTEWYNKNVEAVCKKHNIKMYSVHNYSVKAAFAERAIRTIKSKLYKIFTHFNTYNYLKYLSCLVESYNNSRHRGLIGLTPNQVHTLRDERLLDDLASKMVKQKQTNYGCINSRRWQLDHSMRDILVEGTYVRLVISEVEGLFHKSYLPIYTQEIFTIDKVNREGNPITYTLKDLNSQPIKGMVYRNEIKETVKPEVFDIEKIVRKKYCKKTKRHMVLVKFAGYTDEFNQWIASDDLLDK